MNLQTQINILSNFIKAYEDLAQYAADCPKDYAGEYSDAKDMLAALIVERDKPEEFRWTRMKHSPNGNPRHKTLLDYFCTHEELKILANSTNRVAYDQAVKDASDRVRALGGRMTASGPVISSYNRSEFVRRVGEIVGRNYKSVE